MLIHRTDEVSELDLEKGRRKSLVIYYGKMTVAKSQKKSFKKVKVRIGNSIMEDGIYIRKTYVWTSERSQTRA